MAFPSLLSAVAATAAVRVRHYKKPEAEILVNLRRGFTYFDA